MVRPSKLATLSVDSSNLSISHNLDLIIVQDVVDIF